MTQYLQESYPGVLNSDGLAEWMTIRAGGQSKFKQINMVGELYDKNNDEVLHVPPKECLQIGFENNTTITPFNLGGEVVRGTYVAYTGRGNNIGLNATNTGFLLSGFKAGTFVRLTATISTKGDENSDYAFFITQGTSTQSNNMFIRTRANANQYTSGTLSWLFEIQDENDVEFKLNGFNFGSSFPFLVSDLLFDCQEI